MEKMTRVNTVLGSASVGGKTMFCHLDAPANAISVCRDAAQVCLLLLHTHTHTHTHTNTHTPPTLSFLTQYFYLPSQGIGLALVASLQRFKVHDLSFRSEEHTSE